MEKIIKVPVNFNDEISDLTGNLIYRNTPLYVVTMANGEKFYVVKRRGRYYTIIKVKDFAFHMEAYHTYRDCTNEILNNTKGKFKNWTIEYAKFTSEELFKIKWPL